MAKQIAQWYEWGFWTLEMVKEAVPNLITKEEYESITGEKYSQTINK